MGPATDKHQVPTHQTRAEVTIFSMEKISFFLNFYLAIFMDNPPLRLSDVQGQIQDFLIEGSNLQTGLDLTILSEYLLFFPDFSENSPRK